MWSPVQDLRCFGVAKCSFDAQQVTCSYAVGLELGEALVIKGELGGWYYVKKFDGEAEGIVPKDYVQCKECSVIRSGDTDIVIPKQPILSQEIVASLQEWYKFAKQLYVKSSVTHKYHENDYSQSQGRNVMGVHQKFLTIRQMILDLHECRRKVLSSNLTVEGLKELRKQVATVIDAGNSLLKLDMVVRDELGNPLDPLSTSTVQLFRQHKHSSQKLRRSVRGSNRMSRLQPYNSYSLIISVDSINWRVVDECEMRIFLCDSKPNDDNPAPFTESVHIRLRAGTQQQTPFKFIFSDLGKTDFERHKVYLVAYVMRIGAIQYKEVENKREPYIPFGDKRANIQVKRPYGVAAKDVTYLFREQTMKQADNEIQTVLYLPCSGDDTMDDTFKKLLGTLKCEHGSNGQSNGKETRAVGFLSRFSMISGALKQIQEEQPVLLRGNPIIARKMGFPEIILPNDIRNDLYIKLIRGEFHRTAKTTDRNIEVTVSVHNDCGKQLRGIMSPGNGSAPLDSYSSVVYYHNDKPRWNEYFKVSLPMSIDEFSTAHLKFTFKHRSSSDSKDKAEKPFALAYLKLKEAEGTALKDDTYELILYKIDPKHYRESDVQYLSLPYAKSPDWAGNSKPSCPGFSSSAKDFFYVRTTLCSTNFTQNADLLELLLWVTKLRQVAEKTIEEQPRISQDQLVTILLENLKQILEKVTKVSGDEIVKFIHPILDALLVYILVDPMEQISTEMRSVFGDYLNLDNSLVYEAQSSSSVSCDRSVFNCLLHIFGLILDHKYQNFQSVLNLYIEGSFSSTLAYKKLAQELQFSIKNDPPDKVLKVMKSIEFFFKFIIRSYEIHQRLRLEFARPDDSNGKADDAEFEKIINSLFTSMCDLMQRKGDKNDPYIGAEGGCLKHIPAVIDELIRVFPKQRLTENLVELCNVVPQAKLTNIKLIFISEVVHSELFTETDCRFSLLPTVTQNILTHLPGNDEELRRKSLETNQMMSNDKLKKFFGTTDSAILHNSLESSRAQSKDIPIHSEETEKCVELLGDVLDILHHVNDKEKESHVWYIMQILLRPIIFSIGNIGLGDPLAGDMVVIFLSLLREMKIYHYSNLISSLKGKCGSASDPYKQELLKFLNDVLVVMKNLFQTSYFPTDWNAMILLQNSIVLSALEHFANTIKSEFCEPFEEQPWNNFFICAVSFLTQSSLQLEDFSLAKKNYILHNYSDMRKKAAGLIWQSWFALGPSKRIRFVPNVVGTFLDMAFVPEAELRRTTIPIFFDMMHCEFDQDRPKKSFKEVEDELIKKVVEGIEGGKGDFAFREIFCEIMTSQCANSHHLQYQGLAMVTTLTNLMDLLLQYREVEGEEDPGNRMSCIVNLLDFSKEINRKELYLRYLYKLHDLHIQSKNYTEAGFTLKLHSHQLEWNDVEIPPLLRVMNRHPNLVTQTELKEALYNDIINYFDNAKMWECALEICDEIRQQQEETYNYHKLPKLHRQIADFYVKILDEQRFKPEYFRVAFYGGGFPTFLRDKVFVFRGRPFDQLPEFECRMLGRYLQAELLRNLGLPSDEIRFSNKQYLQICKVEPVMTSSKRLSGMKYANEAIISYYKSNEVDKFTYSRPYHQEPRDPENEFASLCLERYTLWISQSFPGIMSWFPVIRDTVVQIRPIQNALETLTNANENLRRLLLSHVGSLRQDLGELTMKLNGILDAAVMGGVANYEKAFLTKDYLEKNPEDESLCEALKQLIFNQIPIIEECLKVHSKKSQASMRPLHERLEELFKNYVIRMENSYGVNLKNLKDEDLLIEMDKALRKQEARVERMEAKEPKTDPGHGQGQSSSISHHRGSVSTALGRSVGSFASNTNLYQNANGKRSMGTMSHRSQNLLFRRSTHNSFSGSVEEVLGESTPTPRTNNHNPSFYIPPKHSSASASISMSLDSPDPDGYCEPRISLTQTLITQRPPRTNGNGVAGDIRNSWTTGSRLSELSLSSLDTVRPSTLTSESSSRNSVNSPDSAIGTDEAPAPPLPPKQQRERGDLPPPPPPKKPPRNPN